MSLDFDLQTEPRPTLCLHCGVESMKPEQIFSRNITHNLGEMAKEAGIYEVLWRPYEHGYVQAKDIIPKLIAGLSDLLDRPCHFRQFDSPNGWGMYEHFVPFVRSVLAACEENPGAFVMVSR